MNVKAPKSTGHGSSLDMAKAPTTSCEI